MSPDDVRRGVDKAAADLADRFRAVMAQYPEAPVRNTFGSPCAYVNGTTFQMIDCSSLTVAGSRPG